MAAGNHNMTIEQGATFTRDIVYTDKNGTAIDLTGSTITMHVRENVDSSDTLLVASTGSDSRISLTNATAGKFRINVSAADTSALSFRRAVYQIEIEYSDSTVDRILQGNINLSKEVVR